MEAMKTSTIAAIATGPARAGIGIVRLSGPAALSAARSLVPGLKTPKPRYAHFVRFEGEEGELLDEGLLLWFPEPASFTGEEVVELHAHGSPVLLRRMVRLLCRHAGVREALPGEYTQRAFLNGRMDLAQAEGVLALVEAETEEAAWAAASQMEGEWSERVGVLRRGLLKLLARVEGCLDFPEETEGAAERLKPMLAAILAQADGLLRLGEEGLVLRRGAKAVIYGPVNAGKSTLLNALVGYERALTDTEPGTTRDTLEAGMERGGLLLTLLDTAGIREASGIEARGIEATKAAIRGANLALLLIPPGATEEEVLALRALAPPERRMEIYSKADLGEAVPAGAFRLSALTGAGVEALRGALAERLGAGTGEAVAACSERQKAALERCCRELENAMEALEADYPLELAASHLRGAGEALGRLLGEALEEAVLEEIFRQFCVGK